MGYVAERFIKEYEIIAAGERSPKWVEGHKARLRLHLLPFFGKKALSEVTLGLVQDYRIHRMTTNPSGKAPSRSTLHDEVVTLRQVLKTATRYGWLALLPDLSPPYGIQGKVVHRLWFSKKQYEALYTATRRNATVAAPRYKHHAQSLHDMVLFTANTGLRPDEIYRLEHQDVEIVEDEDTDEIILVIEVRESEV